jgi:hypothetical protein
VAIIEADFGGTADPFLSKKQLAQHPQIRRSTRWVEMRVAEGMPSTFDGSRRNFRLSEVRAWVAENLPNVRLSTGPPPPPNPPQGKRRASAAPKRRLVQKARPANSTPAPAREDGDRSRARAIAALEEGIEDLQRRLDELRSEPPPAA